MNAPVTHHKDRGADPSGMKALLAKFEQVLKEKLKRVDDLEEAVKDMPKKLLADVQNYQDMLPTNATTGVREDTPEARERRKLRQRVKVGEYLRSAIRGARLEPGSPEEEFRQLVECKERSIPLEAFENDRRAWSAFKADAASAAPATIGVNMRPLVPSVFAQSVSEFLGIEMPRVGSGQFSIPRITTDLKAAAKAKGDMAEATAAAFTVISAKPKRLSARLSLRAEDLAEVGIPMFESSLRQNLSMVMSNALDVQMLRGTNAGNQVNGLAPQLTADGDPAAAQDFGTIAAEVAAYVEGKHATMLGDLRILTNTAVYARLASLFQAGKAVTAGSPSEGFGGATDGEISALDWLRAAGIEVRTSANMAASASDIGKAIIARGDGMGQDGPGAICPIWGDLEIRDPYTGGASATTHYSLHVLLGDVLIRYPAMFAEWRVKTA